MHVKCLPDARVSLLVGDDGTLRASAQHLLENFMRFASAEPPPYLPLGCCLARKEISRTMRNDHAGIEQILRGTLGRKQLRVVHYYLLRLLRKRLATRV